MGINNVLSAHAVGAGAGQNPDDFMSPTNGQMNGSLPTPTANTNAQAQNQVALTDAQVRRFTLYALIIADVALLYIALVK